ncbi:tRNA (adenosine(37)-N6)-dimethylallyltransferase MiaA [Cochlodiniinecator piscidefendens]|uniref:tRNA (adenosine(37)-N6)-dimethylallyltransferase MiaA n=1 Tax=Cochlodiniinecator piscidefendens TaxID=2715756 RepID=UPI00140BFEA0|nr:tRNA (adenosine(37)-N6)-dimethylallyltransferase MiaA [Cochlodiniinecator piscidefendens]
MPHQTPKDISPNEPVLIAGPTASGKSALALEIAQRDGGVIINADALQVYSGWNILTARPPISDLERAPHLMYGHVDYKHDYSVGHWLRDVEMLLPTLDQRPIIVGGTGLYFRALTEGLAEIPVPSTDIRRAADALLSEQGLSEMLSQVDLQTRERIDIQNPARVQRAWEVLHSTGRPLAQWQDETPPPIMPLNKCYPIVMNTDRDWLNARIDMRFDLMMDAGAIEEASDMLPDWDATRLSSKAIGAPELIAYLKNELSLEDAIEAAKLASRQYAKRQRTWFRKRMRDWHAFTLPQPD